MIFAGAGASASRLSVVAEVDNARCEALDKPLRKVLCLLASAKALLNGKEVQRLGAQGPEIAAGLQLAAAWRLLNPHGSKDDAFRWVQERIALMPPGSLGR